MLRGKKSFSSRFNLLQGFSMVEVIFVIGLMGMTIFVIINLFPYGLRKEKSAEKTTIAVNLAQAKMEETVSKSYLQISVGTTTESNLAGLDQDFASFSRVTAVNYINSELNIDDHDFDLKRIKVAVSWFDAQKNSTSTVTLYSIVNRQ